MCDTGIRIQAKDGVFCSHPCLVEATAIKIFRTTLRLLEQVMNVLKILSDLLQIRLAW